MAVKIMSLTVVIKFMATAFIATGLLSGHVGLSIYLANALNKKWSLSLLFPEILVTLSIIVISGVFFVANANA